MGELKCKMFGGKNSLNENVLMSALIKVSNAEDTRDNEKIYGWLESTAKTSLIVELCGAMDELGYKIVKKKVPIYTK